MGTCERMLRIDAPADEVWKWIAQPKNIFGVIVGISSFPHTSPSATREGFVSISPVTTRQSSSTATAETPLQRRPSSTGSSWPIRSAPRETRRKRNGKRRSESEADRRWAVEQDVVVCIT
jgi:hypothetical protein